MAVDGEPSESRFIVCFLEVGGGQLTVIGPLAVIEMLRQRLGEAPDVELHRFEQPPRSTDTVEPGTLDS